MPWHRAPTPWHHALIEPPLCGLVAVLVGGLLGLLAGLFLGGL